MNSPMFPRSRRRRVCSALISHIRRTLRLHPRSNIDKRSDQLRQETENHANGKRPINRAEVRLPGTERDQGVEDSNTDENKRKSHR